MTAPCRKTKHSIGLIENHARAPLVKLWRLIIFAGATLVGETCDTGKMGVVFIFARTVTLAEHTAKMGFGDFFLRLPVSPVANSMTLPMQKSPCYCRMSNIVANYLVMFQDIQNNCKIVYKIAGCPVLLRGVLSYCRFSCNIL